MGHVGWKTTALVVGWLIISCAVPNKQPDRFLGERTDLVAIPNTIQYHPTVLLDGTVLVVALKQDEQCQTIVTPVYETPKSGPEERSHVLQPWVKGEGRCRRRAAGGEQLTVSSSLDPDWKTAGQTDAEGNVRIELFDAPESALPDTGFEVQLKIRDSTVPLSIPSEIARSLLGALAATPSSRLSRERQAKATAACEAALAAARNTQPDVSSKPDALVALWKSAKSTCADYWNGTQERELVQALAIVHDVHLEQEGREFEVALKAVFTKDGVSTDEFMRAERLLAGLGSLVPPDPQLEKRKKKLEVARRTALEFLVTAANRHVARGDLDAASASVDKARSILSSAASPWI